MLASAVCWSYLVADLRNVGWISMEIAVRAYNQLKTGSERPLSNKPKQYRMPNYERIFAFDTETRTNESQALTFGSFVIMHGEVIEHVGLFYNPIEITERELQVLKDYCKSDITIKLYSLKDFIENVFYPVVHDGEVPCVGFNLPFDLSRLALGYGLARGWMKNGFTLKLSEKESNPAIRVKKMNSAESNIEFHTTKYSRKTRGYFIDCQNLAVIMTDNKHISLRGAAERYNKKHKKLEVSEHGKITSDYIAYKYLLSI
jgi:hypothetical protein